MRIGYGYNRNEIDFARLDCKKVYLDMTGSNRQERGFMMRPGGLRKNDVIVILKAGELGANATAAARAMGVVIEVNEPDGPLKPPGAPAKFTPTDDEDAAIRTLWLNPGYKPSYIMPRVRKMMGWEVERWHLVARYGNRHKR